jgi:hypothetical protein
MEFRPVPKRKVQAIEQYIPTKTLKELINPEVDQEDTIADADGTLADITTKFNTLLSQLESRGILRSS